MAETISVVFQAVMLALAVTQLALMTFQMWIARMFADRARLLRFFLFASAVFSTCTHSLYIAVGSTSPPPRRLVDFANICFDIRSFLCLSILSELMFIVMHQARVACSVRSKRKKNSKKKK